MVIGYSGLVTRYSSIRFAHMIGGWDLRNASIRVRSVRKSINRINHVAKKIPVTAELSEWIRINFADGRS